MVKSQAIESLRVIMGIIKQNWTNKDTIEVWQIPNHKTLIFRD